MPDPVGAYYRGVADLAAPKHCAHCSRPITLAVLTPEGGPSRVNLYCHHCTLEHECDAEGRVQRVRPLLGALTQPHD